jgi:hypothetical protein
VFESLLTIFGVFPIFFPTSTVAATSDTNTISFAFEGTPGGYPSEVLYLQQDKKYVAAKYSFHWCCGQIIPSKGDSGQEKSPA